VARIRRASKAEREARLVEVAELLAARMPRSAVVRHIESKWGVGRRAAQKYVAAADERLREQAKIDGALQFGQALFGYELIMRRQLSAGELAAARTTLDRLVALLGLARQRKGILDLAAIEEEITRLESELAALEESLP